MDIRKTKYENRFHLPPYGSRNTYCELKWPVIITVSILAGEAHMPDFVLD